MAAAQGGEGGARSCPPAPAAAPSGGAGVAAGLEKRVACSRLPLLRRMPTWCSPVAAGRVTQLPAAPGGTAPASGPAGEVRVQAEPLLMLEKGTAACPVEGRPGGAEGRTRLRCSWTARCVRGQ